MSCTWISRNVRKISISLSYQVYSNLLQLPWETRTIVVVYHCKKSWTINSTVRIFLQAQLLKYTKMYRMSRESHQKMGKSLYIHKEVLSPTNVKGMKQIWTSQNVALWHVELEDQYLSDLHSSTTRCFFSWSSIFQRHEESFVLTFPYGPWNWTCQREHGYLLPSP